MFEIPATLPTGRAVRWLCIATGLLILIHLFDRSFRVSPNVSVFEVTKSSFDWAEVKPFNLVKELQPLPTSGSGKLKRIQHIVERPHHFDIGVEQARRKAIRLAAEKAWRSYKTQDLVTKGQVPIHTAAWQDPFAPSTVALIEALDSLWIMGLNKEFAEGVHIVRQIDWDATMRKSFEVQSTTAKVLGGLLAAYDLSKEPILLVKAKELGNMVYMAFDTPNHFAPFWLDFDRARNGSLEAEDNQIAASMTGVLLELTRLAQITGDHKYYDPVAHISDELQKWQNATKLPGMWPSRFDLAEGTLNHDNVFGLGPDSRTTYEYLLKTYALLGGADERYRNMYVNASAVMVSKLLFRPMTPKRLNVIFPGTFHIGNQDQLDPEIQHSGCYVGGMFALAGRLFDNMEHMKLGANMTHGCMWAYNAFAHDVMPETFRMVPCGLNGCNWDEKRWRSELERHYGERKDLPMGFVNARDPSYSLRPETIESIFVMYRVTGHEEYREAAWRMWQAIQGATETPEGNAAVTDVIRTGALQKRDTIESHWLGATLKYFYLIFSAPDVVSLDEWVFNSEGHPFRSPKA